MAMTNSDIQGVNQQSVLTGQVCFQHRVVDHGARDNDNPGGGNWCNNCGKDDAGQVLGKPNGGWGT